MTETQTRIVKLFKTLPPTEQRALVEHLAETTQSVAFYDRMSPDQLAQLDEGIAQAERGDTVPAADVFDRIAKRFGFSSA
jgi:predicted transcriptional regulator